MLPILLQGFFHEPELCGTSKNTARHRVIGVWRSGYNYHTNETNNANRGNNDNNDNHDHHIYDPVE